ncbi:MULTISPECIES: NUDIX hydrolase [unclassified Rhizobium]|uniref:NUDIX hydrolase n=1 Tax=unclassified Rhizobium TaxID=2613769 RepID=UPI002168FB52|nr:MULTISPECIES: NUDIX hydrolase [unclassified Rhizobium]MCS3744105.1 8-oxo-dGTP pyrophosphatase MutT (NUDIX family) [Rhizobium sp. BK661]MCS4096583.1 8-oxo-dGTP pyrophosphatase MutT (NUDIX family) [Rhizobium sp. BK176]
MLESTPDYQSILSHRLPDIQQAGAVCLRRTEEGVEILLVGSKRNGRWGLPKGHIEGTETTHAAAEREAFEEAGIRGRVAVRPFGAFTYVKDTNRQRYKVTSHIIHVTSVADTFPEQATRITRWFPINDAAVEAGQPGLRALLRRLM